MVSAKRCPCCLLLLLLLLSGCARKAIPFQFPLKEGNEWKYSANLASASPAGIVRFPGGEYMIKVLPAQGWNGKEYYPVEIYVEGSLFDRVYLRQDETGLVQLQKNAEERLLTYPLYRGLGWDIHMRGRDLQMRLRKQEDLTVPHGIFRCLRIDFCRKGEFSGTGWISDGIGIVALNHKGYEGGNRTEIELRLKEANIR